MKNPGLTGFALKCVYDDVANSKITYLVGFCVQYNKFNSPKQKCDVIKIYIMFLFFGANYV